MKNSKLRNARFRFILTAVVVLFVTGSVDAAPAPRWSRHLSGGWKFWSPQRETSVPLLTETVVFAGGSAGRLFAFHRESGKTLWKVSLGASVEGQPGTDGLRVYAGDREGRLHARNAATGAAVWSVSLPGLLRGAPIVAAGRLWVMTQGQDILMLDPETGATVFQDSVPTLGSLPLRIASAGPAATTSAVLGGFANGTFLAFDPRSGQRLWQQTLGSAELPFSAVSNPVLHGQRWILAYLGRGLMAIGATQGEVLWRTEDPLALTLCDGPDNSVVAGSLDGRLTGHSAATGVETWRSTLWTEAGLSLAGIACSSDFVVAADSKNSLWILSAKDGSLLRRWNPGSVWGGFSGAPTSDNRGIAILSESGNLLYLEP